MSTLKTALFKWLTSNVDVEALVKGRVYHGTAPRGAGFPRITMFQVDEDQMECASGSTGLCKSIFQISAWAFEPLQADEIIEAVRQSVQGFQGTIDGIEIQFVLCERPTIDTFEKPDDDSSETIYVKHSRYQIMYRVSIPTF